MTSMQAYLAAKYMTGPKADAILARTTTATTKKKKRKTKAGTEGAEASFIKDDEEELRWGKPMETDEPEEVVVASDRSFKKKQVEKDPEGAGWITMREGEREDDGVPVVDIAPAPASGLVMASELRANLPKPKGRKGKEKEDGKEAETVYRDATGRKIEVESKEDVQARLAREALEERRREAEKKEWTKGLVQREHAEALRREMETGKTKGVARYADDADLNDSLKTQERWNDPAAGFLTKKEKKGPRRPEYKGPIPPPNRFGIKPGYRWDGVDRSNGFEKKYFQTINEKGRTKLEAYQWSVDEM